MPEMIRPYHRAARDKKVVPGVCMCVCGSPDVRKLAQVFSAAVRP